MDEQKMNNEQKEEKKGFLHRFMPASRAYIDQKYEKQLKLLKEEKKLLTEELKALKEEKQMLDDQKQLMWEQKKTLDFHLLLSRELQKNDKDIIDAVNELKEYVGQEFQRRDYWRLKPEENIRLAGERSIWVIKCPAPEGEKKVAWGDYAFAVSLKRQLEKLNIYVIIETWQDWGCEEGADVVIVLRGSRSYHPDRRNKNCLYIMWNISHPEKVTKEEYQLYDVVCVGSRYYAEQLKRVLSVPVMPLLQCTDTDLFYPAKEDSDKKGYDYIFIGNSRGIERSSVMYAVENELPLRMWGGGWSKILDGHTDLIEAPFVENDKLPELYRSAKVTLNDHWQDMLDYQFVNNRIFDALACGLPVISDVSDELKEIFPEAVLYYSSKDEFKACVEKVETSYDEIKEKVAAQWPLIKAEYSFEARARQLKEIVDRYHN